VFDLPCSGFYRIGKGIVMSGGDGLDARVDKARGSAGSVVADSLSR
jgi:hypothetical protein